MIEFDKNGYNKKYNIYKSFYYASKNVEEATEIEEKEEYIIRYKKLIKCIYINKEPYYEVTRLRESIETR